MKQELTLDKNIIDTRGGCLSRFSWKSNFLKPQIYMSTRIFMYEYVRAMEIQKQDDRDRK